jgi:imidazolonepropionase-like amidohydrolase
MRSTDDARQQVTRLLDDGADLIKIAVEGGAGFGRSIPTLSAEEIDVIVRTAQHRGTKVSAHMLVAEDLEWGLARWLRRRRRPLGHGPAVGRPGRTGRARRGLPGSHPGVVVRSGARAGEAAIEDLRRFVRGGGEVALGTDYNGYNCPFDPGMPLREIRWVRDAGMTPMQVLVAATSHAGQIFNSRDAEAHGVGAGGQSLPIQERLGTGGRRHEGQ